MGRAALSGKTATIAGLAVATIAGILRTAIALFVSLGLAYAQSEPEDTIEGFEGSLRQQFAQSCRSVHLFVNDARVADAGVSETLRWAGSASEASCIEAHRQLLANLPRPARDRMYRSRYNDAMETCLHTVPMPARADACEGFASDSARRTHLRDYIVEGLTGEACASLLKASGNMDWQSGFCISFEIPPGEEQQWKAVLAKILESRMRKRIAVQRCLPLAADAISQLARAGFDCTSPGAGENQRGRCRRSLQLHDFSSRDQHGVVKASRRATRAIEITGSPTGKLPDVCVMEMR